MICLDTTFLVHLWRHQGDREHPVHRVLFDHPTEVFAVPVIAAGEFLEGAAFVSDQRLADGVRFLGMFLIGEASFETSRRYATLTSSPAYPRQICGSQPGHSSTRRLW